MRLGQEEKPPPLTLPADSSPHKARQDERKPFGALSNRGTSSGGGNQFSAGRLSPCSWANQGGTPTALRANTRRRQLVGLKQCVGMGLRGK